MKPTPFSNTKTKNILKAILFCAIFTGLFVVLSFTKAFIPVKFERFAHGIIGTIAACLTTWIFLKFDGISFPVIGLKWERATLKKFFIGCLIGIALMGSMAMAVIYFSGFTIEVNSNSNILHFLFWTLPLIPLAFMEEVAFRAFPLVTIKKSAGPRMAIIVTSILFAVYHIANGWTIIDSFMGPGVWGIIYGSAAIYSNGVSMPTGLHYAANLATAAFGTGSSFNIWILKQKNGSALGDYQASQMQTLIPQLVILLLGITCMEWILRRKNYR